MVNAEAQDKAADNVHAEASAVAEQHQSLAMRREIEIEVDEVLYQSEAETTKGS